MLSFYSSQVSFQFVVFTRFILGCNSLFSARLRLDRGLIPVVRDAHVPAALLKLWLRSLPEPLLPDAFYSRCLAVCDQPEEACRIVELLPAVNRFVLAKLLELLQVISFC